MTSSPFAERFRELRKRANMSQESLAEKAEVSQSAISGIENGVIVPRRDSFLRLSTALGLSVDERNALMMLTLDEASPDTQSQSNAIE